jgi:hypothetical protein
VGAPADFCAMRIKNMNTNIATMGATIIVIFLCLGLLGSALP